MIRSALLLGALFVGSLASAAPTKVVQTTRTEKVDRGTRTFESGHYDGQAYDKMVVKQGNTVTTKVVIGGKTMAKTEKSEPYANEIGGGGTRVTVEGHANGVTFKKVTTRAAMPGSMGGGYGFKVEGSEPAMP